jgi:hypothetical protein
MMYAWGTGNYPGFDRKSVSWWLTIITPGVYLYLC